MGVVSLVRRSGHSSFFLVPCLVPVLWRWIVLLIFVRLARMCPVKKYNFEYSLDYSSTPDIIVSTTNGSVSISAVVPTLISQNFISNFNTEIFHSFLCGWHELINLHKSCCTTFTSVCELQSSCPSIRHKGLACGGCLEPFFDFFFGPTFSYV